MADDFKPIHTYSDPGFDQHRFYEYELSIRLAADALSYCVRDAGTNKYLHLQAFDLADPSRKPYIPGEHVHADISRLTRLLEDDLKWLANPFSKTYLVVEQGKSTLMPEALFIEQEKGTIFDFNIAGGPHRADELKHDHIRNAGAFVIYYLPASMAQLFSQFFPAASTRHFSGIFIELLLRKFRNRDNNNILYVNAAASHLDIMRIRDKKLDYFNSFVYNTAEDFMYYLVFVVEQLSLNPETVEIVVMGEMEKHSALSDIMHKYIRNIRFIERNDEYRYSFVFDQLPGHYYYNLLNASLCE